MTRLLYGFFVLSLSRLIIFTGLAVLLYGCGGAGGGSGGSQSETGNGGTSANQLPTALTQSINVDVSDSALVILQATDPDGTINQFQVTNQPTDGELSGDAPDLTYTPNVNFTGIDTFEFIVIDNDGAQSEPALITINVNEIDSGATGFTGQAQGIVIDPLGERLLVSYIFSEENSIIAIDVTTGESSVIASATMGDGGNLTFLEYITLDGANGQLFGTTGRNLYLFDDVTGDRNRLGEINSFDAGATRAMVSDSENSRIFITQDDFIIAVDMTSYEETIVSGIDRRGEGPSLVFLYGMAYDIPNNRLIVSGEGGVFTVDLDSGDRTLISSIDRGTGRDFLFATGLALDLENNRVLVADTSSASVVGVDVTTGDRTPISAFMVGTGEDFNNPHGLVFDPNNNNRLFVTDHVHGAVSLDLTTGNRTLIGE